jgi:hypothetical protein
MAVDLGSRRLVIERTHGDAVIQRAAEFDAAHFVPEPVDHGADEGFVDDDALR